MSQLTRKSITIGASCLLLLWASSFAAAQASKGRQLRAGAATSNITPQLGGNIVGGFAPFPSTHIHDELHVRCLVLDDGAVKLVFVVCDLLGIDRQVSDEARAILEKDLGIPPSHVLISATHTHSAISALGKDARILGQTMDEYQRFVARWIVDGVKRAVNLLRPAEIAWGTAEAPEHVNNRRWHMKPNSPALVNPFGKMDKVKMNPPVASPDLVEPAGPVDPTISFIAVREPNAKPIAVFTAYSLHYVGGVGPGHVSADYFGMYCDELTRLLGVERQTPAFVALLANGTSGDINNINFREKRPKKAPYEQMKYVADDVAQKVHASLAKATYRDNITLDARYRESTIGTRRPTKELVEWAKKTLEERPRKPGKTDMPAIYAERTLRMAEHPAVLKLPLQAFRIGDMALATMPCEVFCEIGLEFKKRSPIQPAFMVSLNHGYFGYLPTPKHHELGGYETWLGTNRLEVRASEKMLDALLDMTGELKANRK
ncbi:MAG: neutral/alkaline non-lysosomal ceramidase N-terminal domain-containing protein [Gemmataceae bacterium]|nr:neutral/alkaline non-lysosomal ceramidase N-terminal domain-containing protein [Gemmataceae bacterium]MCI0739026.1 neutral/alkaline non-lysosomal ceramidase N-terminal domain-containing protein [Gemmataceae bacterium]